MILLTTKDLHVGMEIHYPQDLNRFDKTLVSYEKIPISRALYDVMFEYTVNDHKCQVKNKVLWIIEKDSYPNDWNPCMVLGLYMHDTKTFLVKITELSEDD